MEPCPPGTTRCGQLCKDTNTDNDHCGDCFTPCESPDPNTAATCVDGVCQRTCDASQRLCEGICRDTDNDLQHCGACGEVCTTAIVGAAPFCEQGSCKYRCADGLRDCGNRCADTLSSNQDCGDCNNPCTTGIPGASAACAAGSCLLTCPNGLVPCSGQCVDTTNSLTHCGGCNAPCSGAPANAASICTGGGCTFQCNTGYRRCDGACVAELNNLQHCGSCGNACTAPPNATPVCNGVTCDFACNAGFVRLGNRCATFGGVFRTNGDLCSTAACYEGNILNGDSCSCPPGFADQVMQVLDDSNCSTLVNPPFGWGEVHACVGGTANAAADFGGVYQLDRARACVVPNALTGTCTCLSGYAGIELPHNGACYRRMYTVACFKQSSPRSTFAGAFAISDRLDSPPTPPVCLSANPVTGNCSCPMGSSAEAIRSIHGPANSGPSDCSRANQIGANLVFCSVP